MDPHHYVISFFLIITINELSAQNPIFRIALKNDFNLTCIEQTVYTVSAATSFVKNCVMSKLGMMPDREAEIERFCINDVTQTCVDNFNDVFLNCLPEDTHEIMNKIAAMNVNSAKMFCKNDAKHYRDMNEKTCDFHGQMRSNMGECEIKLTEEADSIHLKDLFNAENCQKYEEYYECNKAAAVICPVFEQVYIDKYDGFAELSPCNKQ